MLKLLDQKDLIPRCIIHTGNQKYDVRLYKEFQHPLIKEHHRNGVFDQGKKNKQFMKKKGHRYSIMFRIMLMLHTNM